VSLTSMVSRGVVGRLRALPTDEGTSIDQPRATTLAVRLPGASMRLLEGGLALTAIATAILIGLGR
jgi:hypothetical protein